MVSPAKRSRISDSHPGLCDLACRTSHASDEFGYQMQKPQQTAFLAILTITYPHMCLCFIVGRISVDCSNVSITRCMTKKSNLYPLTNAALPAAAGSTEPVPPKAKGPPQSQRSTPTARSRDTAAPRPVGKSARSQARPLFELQCSHTAGVAPDLPLPSGVSGMDDSAKSYPGITVWLAPRPSDATRSLRICPV